MEMWKFGSNVPDVGIKECDWENKEYYGEEHVVDAFEICENFIASKVRSLDTLDSGQVFRDDNIEQCRNITDNTVPSL